MTTDGKVITITMYCQICNYIGYNIYNTITKRGREWSYISLELS